MTSRTTMVERVLIFALVTCLVFVLFRLSSCNAYAAPAPAYVTIAGVQEPVAAPRHHRHWRHHARAARSARHATRSKRAAAAVPRPLPGVTMALVAGLAPVMTAVPVEPSAVASFDARWPRTVSVRPDMLSAFRLATP